MFEDTIILSRPIKKVEWVEEEFPSLGGAQEPIPGNGQADDMPMDEDVFPQAENIAADQARSMQLEEIRDLFEIVSQSVEKHFGMLSRRMHTVENNVITLALAVAQKIIDKELAVNPNVVRATVAKALQRIDEETNVIIQVNPEDKETIEKYWDEITKSNISGWKLEAKSDIGRGGCVIKSANETIDATIESQMRLVEQVLADSIKSTMATNEGVVQI